MYEKYLYGLRPLLMDAELVKIFSAAGDKNEIS